MSDLRFKALISLDFEEKKERIMVYERQNLKIWMNEQSLTELILGKGKLLFLLAKDMPELLTRAYKN